MDANNFYKKLFTESSKYKPHEINKDEQRRWEHILRYLMYAKGYYNASGNNHVSILDIGCGRGWMTNLLSQHGKVKGIEPVPPVVEFANKIFPDLEILNAYSDDLVDAGEQQQYDVIASSEVIEHVPDDMKDNFVKNISILLKDKGFAIITTPRKEIEMEFRKYSTPKQPVEDWISEDDLAELFAKYNMQPIIKDRISYRPRNRYHPFAPSLEIYQTWLFQKNVNSQ